MNTPRVVTFHGLRPCAWVDALDEVWLAHLGEPAILASRLDVYAASQVRLHLTLPEAWVELTSPIEDREGTRGIAEAVHACFLAAEPILRDRRALLGPSPVHAGVVSGHVLRADRAASTSAGAHRVATEPL